MVRNLLAKGTIVSLLAVGPVFAQEPELTRHETLVRARQEKLQELEPETIPDAHKTILELEKRGVEDIVNFRIAGINPKIGTISQNSGLTGGGRYHHRLLPERDVSMEVLGAYSVRGYQLYELFFGHFDQISPSFFLGSAEFGAPLNFGREKLAPKRFFIFANARYRNFGEEEFFGIGNETVETDRSQFRLEETSLDIVAGTQLTPWLGSVFRAGRLIVDTRSGSGDRLPDIAEIFDPDTIPGFREQPDFLRLAWNIYLDYRDSPSNPHSGGFFNLGVVRVDDRGLGRYEFNRLSADLRHYLALNARHVLAGRAYTERTFGDGAAEVPFYFQSTLGGPDMLRGFRPMRFRDTELIYFSGEYRWEPLTALEFALFGDTGKVFSNRSRFDLDDLHTSYGAGIRFKTDSSFILRLDVGKSREGFRVHLKFIPAF